MMAKTKPKLESRTIRCSALPLILSCGQSSRVPDLRVDGSGPEATLGRAVHAALAAVVRDHLDAPPENLPALATEYGVELDQLRMLTWNGVKIWQSLREEITVVAVEEHLSAEIAPGLELTGSADVIGSLSDEAGAELPVIADWKTGFADPGYSDQLRGYLRLGWERSGANGQTGKAILIWLREQRVEVVDVGRADLDAWTARIPAALASETYSPGDHCTYCPRRLECPALSQMVRAAAGSIIEQGRQGDELTPAKLATLYPRAQMLRRALNLYDDALRCALRSGPLSSGDGRVLSLEPGKRETIHLDPAVAALAEIYGLQIWEVMAAVGESLSLPKTVVADFIGARAARGKKGAEIEAALAKFRETGAVTETSFERISARKE